MEKKPDLDKGLQHLIAEGTADGIGVAVGLWAQNERLPRAPTEHSANPIDDFTVLLTADYEPGKPGYPFEEQSLKVELDAIVSEHIPAAEILYRTADPIEVKRLIRYVVAGQTLEFLKPKADKVRELFERIRKEGINTSLPAGGPNQ